MLTKAAAHALQSGNKAFHSMITKGLIAYNAVDESLELAMHKLGQKLPPRCKACIAKAKQWKYINNNSAVDMGYGGRPLTFNKQLPPAMLRCMSRYWYLRHRRVLCMHLLQPCREVAKQAPLAPDTYFAVTKLVRETAFKDTLKKATAYALHGHGPNVLFRFSLV